MRAKALNSLLLSLSFKLKAQFHRIYRGFRSLLSNHTEEKRLPNFPAFRKIVLPLFFILILHGFQAFAVDPVVKVRFANPKYTCATQTYKVDVEFQCNTADKQLFGMNVRFFYADNILEFVSFGEFVQGYTAVSPNPPIISTGNSNSGMALFGFPGAQEYVNGAIQKTGTTSLTLSTTGWTKIFNVSFHVDDPNVLDKPIRRYYHHCS
jgi:hypothetical protein